ncbi:MAG TPA: RNA polymerase sigma factor [Thermoanaerobaculia bacterium]|nr:RNA polymerase sigma factor [Thermoanaerobaculia bacterium]
MLQQDDSTFEDLRRQLARSVSRICPGWLAASRDDIVQVALLRLVQTGEEAERSAPYPSSYLRKVAYSAMIDEMRRLRRAREVALDPEQEDRPALDTGSNPERNRAGREIGLAIEVCLSGLRQERRMAVTLHLLGHSMGEIAKLAVWNLKRAENLVYRGLDDLRACLTAKGLAP